MSPSSQKSPQRTLKEWLTQESFSLSLSAGFFGFFAHGGFLQSLERALGPEGVIRGVQGIRGASAGALAGGLFSAGVSTDDMLALFQRVKRSDFWDPGLGFGLLQGKKFERLLEKTLGNKTIEESQIPLGIAVFDILARKTRILHEGSLSRIIRGSCSVPWLFHPTWINRRPYLDGGVKDRAALSSLSSQTRLLCHWLPSRGGTCDPPPLPHPNGIFLTLDDLPEVSPRHLDRGPRAIEHARFLSDWVMNQPIDIDAVREYGLHLRVTTESIKTHRAQT